MAPTDLSHLFKRDNMGYVIPPLIIVLLVMIGAGLLVLMAYSVFRFSVRSEEDDGFRARSVEQDDYMRSVRERNRQGLWAESARGMRVGKGRMGARTGMGRVDTESNVSSF